MPIVSPDFICRLIFVRAVRSAFLEYLKLTFSKSTEPSLTNLTAFSGLLTVLFSVKTSAIRLADSSDIVIMTNTIDTIIRLLKIIKLYVRSAEN